MMFVLNAFLTVVAMVVCTRLIKITFKAIGKMGDWLEDLVLGKRK